MGFTKLEFPIPDQYGELGPLVPKFLGMVSSVNFGGGFLP